MTGLDYERFRNYSPGLGTWISQDPAGYIDGANTYQFVGSSPLEHIDTLGMAAVPTTVPGLIASMVGNRRHFGGSLERQTNTSSFLQLNFVFDKKKNATVKRSSLSNLYRLVGLQGHSGS